MNLGQPNAIGNASLMGSWADSLPSVLHLGQLEGIGSTDLGPLWAIKGLSAASGNGPTLATGHTALE